jgi:hypothetical protein
MVKPKSLSAFRDSLARGERPTLTRRDFDPPPRPAGAFDAALSERISQQGLASLNSLSRDSMRQVRDHLSRQLADEEDDPHDKTCEDSVSSGDLGSEIVDFLESCGIDDKILERVRALVESGRGDGTLHITHRGDQDPSGGPSSGYDPTGKSPSFGQHQPPPTPGTPRTGGSMMPYTSPGDADRHAALENMSRIRSFTPADLTYKDGTPFTGTMPNGDQYIHGARLRRPAGDAHQRGHRFTGAMDSAAAKEFADRWPEIARVRVL